MWGLKSGNYKTTNKQEKEIDTERGREHKIDSEKETVKNRKKESRRGDRGVLMKSEREKVRERKKKRQETETLVHVPYAPTDRCLPQVIPYTVKMP